MRACRDAQGARAFLDEAERILGVRPRVIAGDEEAALTFRGALSGCRRAVTRVIAGQELP